jgi:hypothetical protein
LTYRSAQRISYDVSVRKVNEEVKENVPAITTTKERRIIHHSDTLYTSFNILDLTFLSLSLPPSLILININHLLINSPIQNIPNPTSDTTTKDQLTLFRNLPEPHGLVATSGAHGDFTTEGVDVLDLVLVAEESFDVGEGGEIEYFEGAIE